MEILMWLAVGILALGVGILALLVVLGIFCFFLLWYTGIAERKKLARQSSQARAREIRLLRAFHVPYKIEEGWVCIDWDWTAPQNTHDKGEQVPDLAGYYQALETQDRARLLQRRLEGF